MDIAIKKREFGIGASIRKYTSRAASGVDAPQSELAAMMILFMPAVLFLLFGLTLLIPATRSATIWILVENGPVEIATFLLLTIGAFFGLHLAWNLYKQGEHFGYVIFFAVFSAGLLLTGLEEIAWGQQFWGFETPASIKNLNQQGETTLHNMPGFHGKTEVFRFVFGFGGLVGILLTKKSILTKIATPLIMIGFFLVITAHAAVDVFDDMVKVPKYMEAATSKLAELVELLIAAAAFLYLYLKSTLFRQPQLKGISEDQTDQI